jgi:ribonuclease J
VTKGVNRSGLVVDGDSDSRYAEFVDRSPSIHIQEHRLKIVVHQGASQIGGNCIEVIAQGQRIVLDVGVPVDCVDRDTRELPNIAGFREFDSSLLGVFLSHSHLDHYGLAHRLPRETKFFMGRASRRILGVAKLFSPNGLDLGDGPHLVDSVPITLGPFTVTPYLVDHSAYDSYALLVEADGRRLLYSGDFRCHGRKHKLVDRFLKNPPPGVHCVIMEGTNLDREQDSLPTETESQLEDRFAQVFAQDKGMPLVWCSSQNIDRIVTIYRACKRSGRQLILDVYTAELLRALGNSKLPQATWSDVRVYLPVSQKSTIIRNSAFDLVNQFRRKRIFPEALQAAANNSVMLFRPSMIRELTHAGLSSVSSIICSLWRGYFDSDRCADLRNWIDRERIPLQHIHTSGHASLADLKRFRAAFADASVIGIHTRCSTKFAETVEHSRVVSNGESLDI